MVKITQQTKKDSKNIALDICMMMIELASLNHELFDLELKVLNKKIEAQDNIIKSGKGIHVINYPFKEHLKSIELKKEEINEQMESIKKLLMNNCDMLIKDIINASFKSIDDEKNVFALFEPIIEELGSLKESEKYYGGILNIMDKMEEN